MVSGQIEYRLGMARRDAEPAESRAVRSSARSRRTASRSNRGPSPSRRRGFHSRGTVGDDPGDGYAVAGDQDLLAPFHRHDQTGPPVLGLPPIDWHGTPQKLCWAHLSQTASGQPTPAKTPPVDTPQPEAPPSDESLAGLSRSAGKFLIRRSLGQNR